MAYCDRPTLAEWKQTRIDWHYENHATRYEESCELCRNKRREEDDNELCNAEIVSKDPTHLL